MAIANATQAQIQAMRDSLINASKLVDEVFNGGKSNISTMASVIDAELATAKTALDAVVAAAAS